MLQAAIEQLALPGVKVGYRLIMPSDECALLPEEAFDSIDPKIRCRHGAGRIVARELLSRANFAVRKAPSGAPIWPPGIVGSLGHDSEIAVAAVASQREFVSLGIDIEPAEPLSANLVKTIATPREQLSLNAFVYGGRLLFVAKEAVFKAVADLDRIFIDHHDVEIDFDKHSATIRNGRSVELRFCISSHLLALAFIRRDSPRRWTSGAEQLLDSD